MIFPGFPGVLSFFQVFQVEWEPWDDASDSALIEINGDAWKCVANPFWSIITELYHYIAFYLERYRRHVADAWCKRTLR